jgi:hypothetical protein
MCFLNVPQYGNIYYFYKPRVPNLKPMPMWNAGNVWNHVNMHSHVGDKGSQRIPKFFIGAKLATCHLPVIVGVINVHHVRFLQ